MVEEESMVEDAVTKLHTTLLMKYFHHTTHENMK